MCGDCLVVKRFRMRDILIQIGERWDINEQGVITRHLNLVAAS